MNNDEITQKLEKSENLVCKVTCSRHKQRP